MPDNRRLFLLSGGVIFLHTLVTVLEEALFAQPVFREKAGSTFMTLTFYTMAAAVYAPRGGGGGSPHLSRRLAGMIAASAALYVTTTTLSKTALTYIDLPTQSILKSAKLLPVMAGSIVILGQRFTPREWAAAAMLVSGIATFSASGQQPRGAQTVRKKRVLRRCIHPSYPPTHAHVHVPTRCGAVRASWSRSCATRRSATTRSGSCSRAARCSGSCSTRASLACLPWVLRASCPVRRAAAVRVTAGANTNTNTNTNTDTDAVPNTDTNPSSSPEPEQVHCCPARRCSSQASQWL